MLKFIGFLWALPLTIAGLFVAAIGRTRFIGWRGPVLEFEALPGGIVSRVFMRTRTVGAAWGCCLFYDQDDPPEWERRHEHRHALQAMVLGSLWPVAYVLAGAWAVIGGGRFYWDNVLERDAREHQVQR